MTSQRTITYPNTRLEQIVEALDDLRGTGAYPRYGELHELLERALRDGDPTPINMIKLLYEQLDQPAI